MIKVVHIVTRLDLGGAQQNTLYTVAHLDGQRYQPVLLCGRGGTLDGDADRLAQNGSPVRLRYLDDLVREISPLRDITAFFQIYAALRAEAPRIVHTHSSKAGILGRFAAALAGVPVIIHTFHGFGFHDYMNPWVKRLYVFLERLAADVCTRLIFVSKANQDYARRHHIGDPTRFELIRSGVRLEEFAEKPADSGAVRAALGVAAGAPLIVGIGNLKPQKNVMDFVRAAEEIASRTPRARFLFVGDGPARAALEAAAAERGLKGKLAFLGWRRDVGEILKAADIFLLTSLWEGLPRSLIEAMKTGLPCVAYAVDGVLDVLIEGDTGCPVPPGNWKLAAEHVAVLLGEPAKREVMGRRAAAAIGEEFDIDAMVHRQQELYEQLSAAA